LVDACYDQPAGEVRVHRLRYGATLAAAQALLDPHALSPAALAGLCREAFGRSPRMALVTIGVANLDIGDRLSPCVDAAVERVADRIAAHVKRRAARAVRNAARHTGSAT
ncbi:MAG TPA: hypothetical protein PLV92_20690, partial [Pirellulaceae bacterium]|nr:hypothetical protein [Pirellulaceae bacterium]